MLFRERVRPFWEKGVCFLNRVWRLVKYIENNSHFVTLSEVSCSIEFVIRLHCVSGFIIRLAYYAVFQRIENPDTQ